VVPRAPLRPEKMSQNAALVVHYITSPRPNKLRTPYFGQVVTLA
jgi:hypothetical protein